MNSLSRTSIEITRRHRRPFFARSSLRMAAAAILLSTPFGSAAELSVGNVLIRPNGQGRIVVSGSIDNEPTFGVTIMLELVPRAGSIGSVEFTPVRTAIPTQRGSVSIHANGERPDEVRVIRQSASDVDVAQLGDPWPDQGTFTPFDTDQSSSPTLNGAVDDNGTFIAAPVVFNGTLSIHPISVSPDARGIWDVTLSTSRGSSSWEGISTDLHDATIIISSKACESRSDCNDGDDCTDDACVAGVCGHNRSSNSCVGGKPVRKRGSPRRP